MRRLMTICLASTFLLCGTFFSDALGQEKTGPATNALFNPDVTTVWHKLGIPQGVGRFKKFRESRVNRKGDKPEREKKPKLTKLTDAANLSPEAPKMLQAAAKIKMAEDLAPQKLKALKYLASLGCGCYNKKNADMVEGAVLEAMDDCTVAVRREALMLVLTQVQGGQCGCQPACNSKSCCSAKIYKKLEEMVNKVDKTGCPAESDSSIRYLAQQVLNACPYPMMDEVKEVETEEPAPPKPVGDKPTETGDAATEPGSDSQDTSDGEEVGPDGFKGEDPGETDPNQIDPADTDDGNFVPLDSFDDGNDGARSRRRSNMQQVSYSNRLPGTPSLNAYGDEDRAMMQQLEVTGVVRSVRTEKGNATIVFDDPYDFPVGLKVVIATSRDYVSYGIIEITKTGTAVIRIEDYTLTNHLRPTQRVRLGVFR